MTNYWNTRAWKELIGAVLVFEEFTIQRLDVFEGAELPSLLVGEVVGLREITDGEVTWFSGEELELELGVLEEGMGAVDDVVLAPPTRKRSRQLFPPQDRLLSPGHRIPPSDRKVLVLPLSIVLTQ